MNEDVSPKPKKFGPSLLLLLLLLGGTLAVLCHEGFKPYEVFWANDLPLGALVESSARLPASFFGSWQDFYFLGSANPAFPPNLTNISLAIFSPVHQLKFYAPGTMLFLGFGAWFFFRQLRFSTMACVIGGLGAGLNMHFFSNACWGLGQWEVSCGMIFIALGILVSPGIERLWIKAVLAGMCVGMAVMEGNDVGAIFSIYVAIFMLFRFVITDTSPAAGVSKAVYTGVILVLAALLISLSTISTLIGTQMTGTAGVGQSEAEKRAAWDHNTQWSIPKLETLRMFIPGLYGYRMDMYTTSTNPATYYWGSTAEDPTVGELEDSDPVVRSNAVASIPAPPQVIAQLQPIMAGNDMAARQSIIDQVKGALQRRHTGSGEYTGLLVCILAVFGLANAFRKTDSPFTLTERRMIYFWGAVALFSLLAAWGRYGFVYALIYHLPLVANFRNPMKYMHPLNVCMMILAAYGLEAMSRKYLTEAKDQVAGWWQRVTKFELWWAGGCAVFFVLGVAGYYEMVTSKPALVNHLEHSGFDAIQSPQIADFSTSEVGWFLVYTAVSFSVIFGILLGFFPGKKATVAWALLSIIMICDLSRSDTPWIRYYNYKEKIGLNPVTELLQKEPWEHRVNSRIWPAGNYMTPELTYLCHWWLENDYPFHDIQSLEIDQSPRMPILDSKFLGLFAGVSEHDLSPATRLWRLSNTRYLVAGYNWVEGLNQLGQPKNSFRSVMRLNLVNKPGITTPEDSGDRTLEPAAEGQYALIEYTAALPRVKLYSDWKIVDDETALHTLASPAFEPASSVLVAKDTPVTGTPVTGTNSDPGTVKITEYKSKHIIMDADAKTAAVLLLNDRTGDSWEVTVDGQPAPFLRCNYIMQGTFVPAGHHKVEFSYNPPLKLMAVSLTAFAFGLLLAGYAIVTNCRRKPDEIVHG